MVRIKNISRPRVVLMALEDETEVPPRETEASPDASPSSADGSAGGCESRFGGSDSEASESEESSETKVAAGITFDLGPSSVKKARIASLESCAHYFPRGHCRAPGKVMFVQKVRAARGVRLRCKVTLILR
jgi:hypothetical protein